MLPVVLASGRGALSRFREPFLAVFVVGWVLQTLLGAWQYLLPMARPGHPNERRRWLSAIEAGGTLQAVLLNAGVALLTLAGAAWAGDGFGALGAVLALVGGGVALVKAWTFPTLGRIDRLAAGGAGVWSG
jgi:hypothetical protein